jgi:hypothetical protein
LSGLNQVDDASDRLWPGTEVHKPFLIPDGIQSLGRYFAQGRRDIGPAERAEAVFRRRSDIGVAGYAQSIASTPLRAETKKVSPTSSLSIPTSALTAAHASRSAPGRQSSKKPLCLNSSKMMPLSTTG